MKIRIAGINIYFIFIIIGFQLTSCSMNNMDDNEFEKLKPIFEKLNICLNVNEGKWNDTIKLNPDLKNEWRYFCDTTYYKIYKLGPEISFEEAFLLEVKINHGSGEYDNFVIKKNEDEYKVTCEFKGYLKSILEENGSNYKFLYRIFTDDTNKLDFLVVYNNGNLVIDSVLGNKEINKMFYKGKSFCD